MSIFEKLKAEQEAKRKQTAGQTADKVVEVPFSPQIQQPAMSAPPPTPQPTAEKTVEKVGSSSNFSTPTQPSTAPSPPPSSLMQKIAQQQPIQCVPEPKLPTRKWDGTPVKEEKGLGIMVHGLKGDGKTTFTFSIVDEKLNPNDKLACVSFDEQSEIIKEGMYNSNPRIQVWDALKYYDASDDKHILESSSESYDFLVWLLGFDPLNPAVPTDGDIYKFQPDWIVIDGLEIFKEKMEYKMRSHQGYQPYEFFANYGAWHQRTNFMDMIDILCKRLAKKGVIYTSYTKMQTVKDKATGEITIREPSWAGNTKTKTRIVIRVWAQSAQNGGRDFWAEVENSKVSSVPTGIKKLVGRQDGAGNFEVFGFKQIIAEGKTLP